MKKILTIIGAIVAAAILLLTIAGIILAKRIKQYQANSGTLVEWSIQDGESRTNLPYGQGSRNKYDLYIPANTNPKSLILFIHGGAWMGGEKEDIAYAARRFAKRGYITATMNYTRIQKDSIDYPSSSRHASFASMISEIQSAVAAIKKECSQMGYELNQMAVGGYSAGAHLAMLYATRYAQESPLPVKFQISWVGPTDIDLLFPTKTEILNRIAADPDSPETLKEKSELKHFIFGLNGIMPTDDELNEEHIKEVKRSVSPVYLVGRDTPPAVLAYGENDNLVAATQGEMMAEALRRHNIDHQLFIFPNSGHELGGDAEYTTRVNDTIADFCKKYFGE